MGIGELIDELRQDKELQKLREEHEKALGRSTPLLLLPGLDGSGFRSTEDYKKYLRKKIKKAKKINKNMTPEKMLQLNKDMENDKELQELKQEHQKIVGSSAIEFDIYEDEDIEGYKKHIKDNIEYSKQWKAQEIRNRPKVEEQNAAIKRARQAKEYVENNEEFKQLKEEYIKVIGILTPESRFSFFKYETVDETVENYKNYLEGEIKKAKESNRNTN